MTRNRNYHIGRRTLLKGAAIGVGAWASGLGRVARAIAERDADAPEHRFISCYFNGAWDILLGADARDPAVSYAGIDLGTDLLPAAYRTPIAVNVAGTEVLWGAPLTALAAHADTLTLFRGVNMNTVAHPTGRAYVNTFIPPAGVLPRGDSLATAAAASQGELADERVLPNVSITVPSFNLSFSRTLTATRVGRAPEILDLLRPVTAALPDTVEQLLVRAQDESSSCVDRTYRGAAPADELNVSRDRVRRLLREDVARHFDLGADTADMVALRARYGFGPNAPRNNPLAPGVAAAVTAQLVRTGLARAVTVQLQNGLDTHGPEWRTQQPTRLADAANALAALLADLREEDPRLERTTVVVHSEFSRTPRLNGRTGRDHWFANAVLVFGGRLRRGVFGATGRENLGLLEVDLSTGLPSAGGTIIRPEHIGASLVASLGGDSRPFRVAPLSAWIQGGQQ